VTPCLLSSFGGLKCLQFVCQILHEDSTHPEEGGITILRNVKNARNVGSSGTSGERYHNPIQVWTGPDCSRMLKPPDNKTKRHMKGLGLSAPNPDRLYPPPPKEIFLGLISVGTAVAKWLRCWATNRKVAGSIPDGVIGIFHRMISLGSTKPRTKMSTRSISWGIKAAGA